MVARKERALITHFYDCDRYSPAFSKTVAAANLIARRKVSTLVLVEKVTLLEKWKE